MRRKLRMFMRWVWAQLLDSKNDDYLNMGRFYKTECYVDENEVVYFSVRRKGYPEFTWPQGAMTEETANEVVAKLNHDHGYTP